MINKLAAGNALTYLYDNFNDDDAEGPNELAIIAAYIKQLERKTSTRIVFTKHELWLDQAPSWNFELNENELLATALVKGYVTSIGDDKYLVNNDY